MEWIVFPRLPHISFSRKGYIANFDPSGLGCLSLFFRLRCKCFQLFKSLGPTSICYWRPDTIITRESSISVVSAVPSTLAFVRPTGEASAILTHLLPMSVTLPIANSDKHALHHACTFSKPLMCRFKNFRFKDQQSANISIDSMTQWLAVV